MSCPHVTLLSCDLKYSAARVDHRINSHKCILYGVPVARKSISLRQIPSFTELRCFRAQNFVENDEEEKNNLISSERLISKCINARARDRHPQYSRDMTTRVVAKIRGAKLGNDSFQDLWGTERYRRRANAHVMGLSKHRQDDISIITYRP